MTIKYEERDGLKYPSLAVTEPQYDKDLSKYGTIYKKYLEETQPGRYAILVSSLKLMEVCHKKEAEANQYETTILNQLRKKNPPPQTEDTMEMIQYNNWLLKTAEEIVLNDVIYQK